MAQYSVTVTYTVEVDDELALRDAGFRLWRERMGPAADTMSTSGQESVVVALSQFIGGEPAPEIPGARVLTKVVNVDD